LLIFILTQSPHLQIPLSRNNKVVFGLMLGVLSGRLQAIKRPPPPALGFWYFLGFYTTKQNKFFIKYW
jgi:hypothetical protein